VNSTHDPELRSWVTSAQGQTDFPIQNLPLGVFRQAGSGGSPRVGIAIGDQVLDVTACRSVAGFAGPAARAVVACGGPSLYSFLALWREHLS
jgi:fumarylacetoacetase